MGRQVVKQPDGNFAIWSSVVDDFILGDATEEEIREFWIKESLYRALEKAKEDMDESFETIKKYGHDTWGQTYEEYIELRDSVHNQDICEDCDITEAPGCNKCIGA